MWDPHVWRRALHLVLSPRPLWRRWKYWVSCNGSYWRQISARSCTCCKAHLRMAVESECKDHFALLWKSATREVDDADMRNSASKKKKMPKGATTRLDAAFEDIIHSPPVQMSNRLAGGWLSSRLVWRSRRIKMSRKHSRVQTPQAAMQKGKKSEFTKNQEGASVLSNINKKLCTSNDDTARQLLRRQYLGVVLEVPEARW